MKWIPYDIGNVTERRETLRGRGIYTDWRDDPDRRFAFDLASDRVGRQVILCNGCFDMPHAGHISLLQFAAFGQHPDLGPWRDRWVIAAANHDETVRKIKRRQCTPLLERLYVLSAIHGVRMSVGFGEDTPLELAEFIKPDVLMKGPDYMGNHPMGYEHARCVIIAPRVFEVSTTATIDRAKFPKA